MINNKYSLIGLLVVGFAALSACSSFNFSNHINKQGNLSVIRDADKLKLGMSKQEVKNLMGSSLVTPMFNANRWDYTNTVQAPNKPIIIHSVSLYFKNDHLSKVVKQQPKSTK